MKKSDFYFDLPKELIAQDPIPDRDQSKLLHLDRNTGEISHNHFFDISLNFVFAGSEYLVYRIASDYGTNAALANIFQNGNRFVGCIYSLYRV